MSLRGKSGAAESQPAIPAGQNTARFTSVERECGLSAGQAGCGRGFLGGRRFDTTGEDLSGRPPLRCVSLLCRRWS
ncbi:hypothetical protein ES707_19684 [subsurface metagenome]